MRQTIIYGVLIAAMVALPMVATAETVFHLDTPQEGATVFGLVEVRGWILDDGQECGPPPDWQDCDWGPAGVSAIDLYVDDIFVAGADLWQPRWDVLQAYPWYAGTPYERPGFSVSFNAAHYTSGLHDFFLLVTYSDMTEASLGHTTVMVEPNRNQAPFGELETPGPNQPMGGVYPVAGWALDDSIIAKIEILVDGLENGPVNSGYSRPDVADRFPSHPGAESAGFIRMLNTTELTNGIHSVAIKLTDEQGAVRVIGRRFVHVFNTAANLPPFGGIDWPLPGHIMYSSACNVSGGWSAPPYDEPEQVEWVAGWALDVGSRTDPGGVAYVELLIDGNIELRTLGGYDSFYFPWVEHLVEDGWVNDYGLVRHDIGNLFPDVPNSTFSGFFFVLDMAQLIAVNSPPYAQGYHMLKIRAGDWENNVTDIARILVRFDCNDDRDRPSWGDIYSPAHTERVAGVVEVTGWAIDLDQIETIEIRVNNDFVGYADEAHLPSPWIDEMYPWLGSWLVENAAWRYDMDTVGLNLPNGENRITVVTWDKWGSETIIGERYFVIDNSKNGAAVKGVALN
ncbi:MAG: hypothetical protein K8R59_14430 [Thermoanaerobaculales bacterium]|nr:hypothetical protein [Thermoanaerobaculales bacterium]